MLPPAHRLRDADSFRIAVRRGRRAGSRTLVVHLVTHPVAHRGDESDNESDRAPARVGFVVSKAVGNAVIRNRVKRRLRHLAREHVTSLPGSAVLVVRALPEAATATWQELGTDLTRSLQRVLM